MKVNAVVLTVDTETHKGELIATAPDGTTSQVVPLTTEGIAIMMSAVMRLLGIFSKTPGMIDEAE